MRIILSKSNQEIIGAILTLKIPFAISLKSPPVATIFFLQNLLSLSVTLIPRKPTKENNDDIDSEQQGCEIKLPIDI